MKRKTTLWRGDLYRADRGNLQHFKQRYFVLEGREVDARQRGGSDGATKNVRYTLSYWRRAEDYAASAANEEYEMLQQSQKDHGGQRDQQQRLQRQNMSSFASSSSSSSSSSKEEDRDVGEREDLLEQREQRARDLAQTARDRMTTAQRVKDAFRGIASDGRVAAK